MILLNLVCLLSLAQPASGPAAVDLSALISHKVLVAENKLYLFTADGRLVCSPLDKGEVRVSPVSLPGTVGGFVDAWDVSGGHLYKIVSGFSKFYGDFTVLIVRIPVADMFRPASEWKPEKWVEGGVAAPIDYLLFRYCVLPEMGFGNATRREASYDYLTTSDDLVAWLGTANVWADLAVDADGTVRYAGRFGDRLEVLRVPPGGDWIREIESVLERGTRFRLRRAESGVRLLREDGTQQAVPLGETYRTRRDKDGQVPRGPAAPERWAARRTERWPTVTVVDKDPGGEGVLLTYLVLDRTVQYVGPMEAGATVAPERQAKIRKAFQAALDAIVADPKLVADAERAATTQPGRPIPSGTPRQTGSR